MFCSEFEHTSFEGFGSIVDARGDASNRERNEWTRKGASMC